MQRLLKPVGTLIEEFDIDELETLDVRKLSQDPNLSSKLRRIVFGASRDQAQLLHHHHQRAAKEDFQPAEFVSVGAYRSIITPDELQLTDSDDINEMLRTRFSLYDYESLLFLFAPKMTKGCPHYKPEDSRIQQLLLRPRLRRVQSPPKAPVYGPVQPAQPENERCGQDPKDFLQTAVSLASLENLIEHYNSILIDPERCLVEDDANGLVQQTTTQKLADVSALVPATSAVVFGGLEQTSAVNTDADIRPQRKLTRALNASVLDKFHGGVKRFMGDRRGWDGDLPDDHIEFDSELVNESSAEEEDRRCRAKPTERFSERVNELKRVRGPDVLEAADPQRFLAPLKVGDVAHFARPADRLSQVPPQRSPQTADTNTRPLWDKGGAAFAELRRDFIGRFQSGADAAATTTKSITKDKPRSRLQPHNEMYLCFSAVCRVAPAPQSLLKALDIEPEVAPDAVPDQTRGNATICSELELVLAKYPDHGLRLSMQHLISVAKREIATKAAVAPSTTLEQKRANILKALFD